MHAFRPLARPSLGRSARRKVLLVSTSLLLLAMPISSMSGHKLKNITPSTIGSRPQAVRKTAVKWPNSIFMAPDPPIRHNLMSLTNTHHFQLTRPLISTRAARGGLKTCISVFAWELQWEISFGGVQILPIGLRTPFCTFPVRPSQYALNALGLTPVGPTVHQ